MSRILLVRPPAVFSSSAYSAALTMPLALGYLSASLLEHGHQVENIDALGAGIDHIGVAYSPRIHFRGLPIADIVDRIVEPPDGIGVSSMFSQDWPHVEDMINAIHEKFPDVPLIVGGEHATAAGEHVLRSCRAVTHVAAGEGDLTIVDWADWLDERMPIERVQGICYLDRAGNVTTTGPRPRIKAIDDLPWPAWHLFDLEPYFAAGEGAGVERGRCMPILATRGCPFQCTFCSSPTMWTTRYVMRRVSSVVDEIEHYLKTYRAANIDFYDLTAIIRKDWILQLCREIEQRRLDFTWQLPSGTRSEALDGEVLEAMSRVGCRNVTYAPESGSPRTLKAIKKKVSLPKISASIAHAKKAGIVVKCNLIIGFPHETRVDVLQTVGYGLYCAWLGVDDVGIYPFSPYPGSELHAQLVASGVITGMDREYFASLMSFMDLKRSSTYCERVGPFELSCYRLVGMSVCYGLSYALHPSRMIRSIRNYRSHRSESSFEVRLFGMLRRRQIEKRARSQSHTASGAAR